MELNKKLQFHPFVVSRKTGKYVAHTDKQNVSQGKVVTDDVSDGFDVIINDVLSGRSGSDVFFDQRSNQKYAVSYTPIDRTDWSVVCYAPYSDFYSGAEKINDTGATLSTVNTKVQEAITAIGTQVDLFTV